VRQAVAARCTHPRRAWFAPAIALAFVRTYRQIAPHENRWRNLHYRLHYYPLASAGGAVFFILDFSQKSPLPVR
jgi:hypothetical protein